MRRSARKKRRKRKKRKRNERGRKNSNKNKQKRKNARKRKSVFARLKRSVYRKNWTKNNGSRKQPRKPGIRNCCRTSSVIFIDAWWVISTRADCYPGWSAF